jgi:hypothetical protein
MIALPFTPEQFFGVFARYNAATWPAPAVLPVVAWAVVLLAARGGRRSGRIVTIWLGLLWLWMGIVYHVGYFRAINPVAAVFGAAFVLQGLLLLRAGARDELAYTGPLDARSDAGTAVLLYALIIYPWVGLAVGHRYLGAPTFGVPCPSTAYTLGMLLWSSRRVSATLLIIPVAWALIATSAAIQFGVWEDLGLIVAAVVAVLAVRRRSPVGSEPVVLPGIGIA